MNVLLLIGVTIFIGTLFGKISQKIKIPQVTGYIVAGLLMGQSGAKLISPELIELLKPVDNLALGIIGFMLGSELKWDIFKNRGRSIYSILFCQGIMTFIIVTTFVTLVTKKLYFGILLGAIATATDPAATADVLWEHKSRGPLTSTLLAIVALDDVLALIIYAFAGIFAKLLIIHADFSFEQFMHAFTELGTGVIIGSIGGILLFWLLYYIKDKDRVLPFSLAVIVLIVGLALHFKIDLILASMFAGILIANIATLDNEEIVNTIKRFSIPIYVLRRRGSI